MAENPCHEILPRRMIRPPMYVSAFSDENIGEPSQMRTLQGGRVSGCENTRERL